MFFGKIKRRIKYTIKRATRFCGYEIFPKKEGYNYIPSIYGGDARRLVDIKEMVSFGTLAKEAIDEGRTLLSYNKLYTAYQVIENAAKNKNGAFYGAEVGVYKGGMSKFITKTALQFSDQVNMYSIDTFAGHAANDIASIDSNTHSAGKFNDASYEDVKKYLSGLPIQVIHGRIEDASRMLADKKFHFVHIDTDLYGPTKYALTFFGERMMMGGVIVVDDALSKTCPGVKKAIDEYIESGKNMRKFFLLTNQCIILF
ncbi:MAG: class I SAM-dependent methyltransferase [Candidatus Niyogibacteria bacterium]|nr:class I SAM-dependent methyltransferase [Candidatus Niyogibacteria bacterium]